jgi:ZIP family zinc transporter
MMRADSGVLVSPALGVARYALLPVAATVVGALAGVSRDPGPRLRSAIQHFAAGVVFSVVGVELLPDITRTHEVRDVVIGFAAGIALMLVIRRLTAAAGPKALTTPADASASDAARAATVSVGMLVAVGIDILIDGLLVGIAFAAGQKEGVLLTIALAVELLSLGLAITAEIREANGSRLRAVVVPSALSLLLVVGAVGGATLLAGASSHVLAAVLAFGAAALLFLVTEELLVEAHEVPETTGSTLMFFVGFLLFLVLGMVA